MIKQLLKIYNLNNNLLFKLIFIKIIIFIYLINYILFIYLNFYL